MCVNEKIELFMAMRIRLAAAEAERKGLHYVATTCCYGVRASSPCTAAPLPAPHPALILTGLGWRVELSAGLAVVCPAMGVLLPALCPLLPRTGLEVPPNLPALPVQRGDGGMLVASGSPVTTVHSKRQN